MFLSFSPRPSTTAAVFSTDSLMVTIISVAFDISLAPLVAASLVDFVMSLDLTIASWNSCILLTNSLVSSPALDTALICSEHEPATLVQDAATISLASADWVALAESSSDAEATNVVISEIFIIRVRILSCISSNASAI